MKRPLLNMLGAVMKLTAVPRLRFFEGVIGDGKPRIYIANSACAQNAVVTLSALNAAKPCMLVMEKRYRSDRLLHAVNRRKLITAAGGIDTVWLHSALKRLRGGESLLIFPEEETGENVKFNPAFVLLSLLSGAEIVPLYSAPKRTLFGRFSITAGEPLMPDSNAMLTAAVLEKEGKRVQSALALLAEM